MLYSDLLKNNKKCPFCDGNVNEVIYKSDYSFITYAISPYEKHHLMVIPIRHIESISELTTEERLDIYKMEIKALEMLRKLGHSDASFLAREGHKIHKTVPHVHYHVIPDCIITSLKNFTEERHVMNKEETEEIIKDLKGVI